MTLQKTASKTALLLQCPRPFADDTETEADPPGEAAIYGTRWHKATASTLTWLMTPPKSGDSFEDHIVLDDEELARHVASGVAALDAWMRPEGNPFGLAFKIVEVETSRALDLTKSSDGTVKAILHEADDYHEYSTEQGTPLPPNMLAGTADVVLEAESHSGIFRVVLDHKTGEDHINEYPHPASLPQLQSLAEMWEADAVAILHAPKDSPVVIYAEPIPRGISRFRHELWRANRLIDSGFMRPGPECKFCPARGSCPAKQGELIASTTALVRTTLSAPPLARIDDGINPGRFHQLKSELEKLIKQATAQTKAEVKAGALYERPDGKVLEIQTVQVERLSKKSILEAYGKTKGEEMLQALRDAGALVVAEEERLVAK